MHFRKVMQEAIRKDGVVADVHAVVAAQVGEQGSQRVTSRSQTRIVQRRGPDGLGGGDAAPHAGGHHQRRPNARKAHPKPRRLDRHDRPTAGAVVQRGLTPEELDAEGGEQLPDREAMSLLDLNLAAPVNAAVAANVLSDDSVAIADADQHVYIEQENN